MSETPWTPGPWRWGDAESWEVRATGERMLSAERLEPDVARADGYDDSGVLVFNREADARLIAAAPEMADLLDEALDAWAKVDGARDLDAVMVDVATLVGRIRGIAPGPRDRVAEDDLRHHLAQELDPETFAAIEDVEVRQAPSPTPDDDSTPTEGDSE